MELTITLIVLLASIVVDVMVISGLKSFRPKEVELTATFDSPDRCCGHCACMVASAVETMDDSLPLDMTPVVVAQQTVDESRFAWKNRTEEPRLAPPSPHGPPPVPGPLERPYGFSR